MDESFGHWLAGFIDGEGSFGVSLTTNTLRLQPVFALMARDDDAEIVREAKRFVGAGTLCPQKPRGVRWQIQDAAGCLKLIEVLDRFPLRAKKRRDFDLWKQIVMLKTQHKRGDSWDEILRLRERLMSERRYHQCDQP